MLQSDLIFSSISVIKFAAKKSLFDRSMWKYSVTRIPWDKLRTHKCAREDRRGRSFLTSTIRQHFKREFRYHRQYRNRGRSILRDRARWYLDTGAQPSLFNSNPRDYLSAQRMFNIRFHAGSRRGQSLSHRGGGSSWPPWMMPGQPYQTRRQLCFRPA